jgi:hypothetical protein
MNSAFVRFVCRSLALCLAALPLQSGAGMIATDQTLGAAQAQAARNTVSGFVGRSEVAAQLQALGVSPDAAASRVAALTDKEVAELASRVDGLPAGAGGVAVGMFLVVIFLIWRFNFSDQAKAGEGTKVTPAKPAPAKPAPAAPAKQ